MTSSSAERNPVEQLAEEFAERYRRGERPPLAEYVERCPEHADEIRALFPALVVMEQLKPATADATGAYEGAAAPGPGPLDHLGDYHILREVGRGGMGVVYEAEQVSLGRHVALKVLPRQALLNATYLERFRREAKAAARLHHTNIVPVFGVGEHDGLHFYAMQFIRGEALDRVLHDLRCLRQKPGAEETPPTVSEESVAHSLMAGRFADPGGQAEAPTVPVESRSSLALSASGSEAAYYRGVARIGLQVAEALAYAHRNGILHRDVKPSNLLLDAQGTVWITDFGLAKAEGADELTHTGDIVGTVRFMAPERFDGHSLPQSDIYSLGVTLYELVTLRPAFDDANKARLIQRVLHEPPLPPCRRDPHIPRDLETVVLKCLAKEPAERYPSAEAMAEDLRRFLADRPILARRTPWHERTWRWCRRNPAVAALVGVIALMLLCLAGGSLWFAARVQVEGLQRENERQRADRAEREAKEKRLDAFYAQVSRAQASLFSKRTGQRFGSLEAVREAGRLARELQLPAEKFDELRRLAISALTLPDVRTAHAWEGWPEGSSGLAVDDRMVVYARSDKQGNVSVRRIASDREIAHIAGDGRPCRVYLSPAGDLVLVLRSDHLEVWRPGEDRPRSAISGICPPLQELRMTHDGQRLAVALRDGTINLYTLPEGRQTRRLPAPPGAADSEAVLAFSPDGNRLAAVHGRYGEPRRRCLRVHDLGTDQPPIEFAHEDSICTIAWYPDGRTIAAGGWDTTEIYVWDVPTRKTLEVISTQKGGAPILSISRTGDLFASASNWWGGARVWDPQTGQVLLSVPGTFTGYPQATPDGRLFDCRPAGTRLRIEECVPGHVRRTLVRDLRAEKGRQYFVPTFHPDGRLMAVGMETGVGLWDLLQAREVGFLPTGYTQTAAFEPSGNLLTYGAEGLLRWPIRAEADAPGKLHIGPPQCLLDRPVGGRQFSLSQDGRVIAAATDTAVFVLHADRPGQPIRLGPHPDVRCLAVSPDGRFVATAAFGPHGIKVWEAAGGKHVIDLLPGAPSRVVSFTPDGKHLVVGHDGDQWFEAGTWREVKGIAGWSLYWGCISPDGRLLASPGGGGIVLFEGASGRRLAEIGSPNQGRVPYLAFNRDASRLVAADMDNLVIHAWDLRKLRGELSDLGLDWDAPPYPPAEEDRSTAATGPLEVKVDSGGLISAAKKRQAMQWNDKAWRLVTGPADQRDPARALKLIQEALRLDPDESLYLNTLGVVQYRGGQLPEAVATLEKSLAAGKGESDAFDLFFLAMAHARLGNPVKARECFDRAVKWCETRKDLSPQHVEELKGFRAEAEQVLRGR
jgi:serine/threonine protein kinase/WD40 repeat protein